MQEAVFFLLKIEASGNFVAELLNNSIWISFMIIEENWKKKLKNQKKKRSLKQQIRLERKDVRSDAGETDCDFCGEMLRTAHKTGSY